jgi:hypothetical protein
MINEREKLRTIPTLRDVIVYWLAPIVWMGFIFPTNRLLNTNSTSHIIVPILKWETRYFLFLSKDLQYITIAEHNLLEQNSEAVSKMLNGLIKSLKGIKP